MIGCQKNKIQFKCHDSTALTFKKYIICCRYQNPKSKPGRRAFYFEEITKLWSRNLVTHPTITKSNGRRGGPSQSGKRVGPGPFLFALASQRSCFLGDRCLVRKRQNQQPRRLNATQRFHLVTALWPLGSTRSRETMRMDMDSNYLILISIKNRSMVSQIISYIVVMMMRYASINHCKRKIQGKYLIKSQSRKAESIKS